MMLTTGVLQADGGLELLAVHEKAAVAGDRDHVAAAGRTSLAAIAVGSAKPMPARPLAMSTVPGSWAGNIRPIHSLCRPTSETSTSLRPQRLADVAQDARRAHREVVVLAGLVERAEHDAAQPVEPSAAEGCRRLQPAARRASTWAMSPISSTSGMKNSSISAATVSIDHDLLVAARVPVLGRVLDQVVADRDDHVGVVEPGHLVVARLEPDGAQRVGILVVEQALGHERLGHRDPGRVHERAQRPAGVGADGAVAGQDDRVARRP